MGLQPHLLVWKNKAGGEDNHNPGGRGGDQTGLRLYQDRVTVIRGKTGKSTLLQEIDA